MVTYKVFSSFLSCQIIPPLYKDTTITMCAWGAMNVPSTICPWFSRAETVHKSKANANHVLSSLICTGTFYRTLTNQKFLSSDAFILVLLLFWTLNPPFHINDVAEFQELFITFNEKRLHIISLLKRQIQFHRPEEICSVFQ